MKGLSYKNCLSMARGVCEKANLGVRLIRERNPKSESVLGQFQTRELRCSQPEHPNPTGGEGGAGGEQGSFVPRQGTVPWLTVQQILNSPQKEGSVQQMANSIALGHKSWVWLFQQPDTQGENKAAGKGAI